MERAGVAHGRGPGGDVGDRAVRQGGAQDSARDRCHRVGGIRHRAPAGRDHRERHDLLGQAHRGAGLSRGSGHRRRADRGQRQRGRRSRGPAGRDQLAAGEPARYRCVGVSAHGAVRRGAPGRAARGAGAAAGPVPARPDRDDLAAGQRHRAAGTPGRVARGPVRPASDRDRPAPVGGSERRGPLHRQWPAAGRCRRARAHRHRRARAGVGRRLGDVGLVPQPPRVDDGRQLPARGGFGGGQRLAVRYRAGVG